MAVSFGLSYAFIVHRGPISSGAQAHSQMPLPRPVQAQTLPAGPARGRPAKVRFGDREPTPLGPVRPGELPLLPAAYPENGSFARIMSSVFKGKVFKRNSVGYNGNLALGRLRPAAETQIVRSIRS